MIEESRRWQVGFTDGSGRGQGKKQGCWITTKGSKDGNTTIVVRGGTTLSGGTPIGVLDIEDAILMAAAPDLLRSLEKVVAVVGHKGFSCIIEALEVIKRAKEGDFKRVKRLESAVCPAYGLEVGECACGYHFGVDATYIDQVTDFKFHCPSCDATIDTKKVFKG